MHIGKTNHVYSCLHRHTYTCSQKQTCRLGKITPKIMNLWGSLIYILTQIKLQIGPTNHSTHPSEKRKGENDSIGLYINISRKCHLHGSNFYILVISHIVIHKPHPLVAQKSSTRGGKDCICKISRNCHSHGSNF